MIQNFGISHSSHIPFFCIMKNFGNSHFFLLFSHPLQPYTLFFDLPNAVISREIGRKLIFAGISGTTRSYILFCPGIEEFQCQLGHYPFASSPPPVLDTVCPWQDAMKNFFTLSIAFSPYFGLSRAKGEDTDDAVHLFGVSLSIVSLEFCNSRERKKYRYCACFY